MTSGEKDRKRHRPGEGKTEKDIARGGKYRKRHRDWGSERQRQRDIAGGGVRARKKET